MDFSKIKKIFYIVAIISMLLSIKSKVFAYSYTDNQSECITDALSRFKNSFNIEGNMLLVATDEDNYTYVGISEFTDVEYLDYISDNPNFRINGEYQLLFYRYNNTTFDDRSRYATQVYNALINNTDSCYSPYTIYAYPSGDTIYTPDTPILYPHFDNTTEIENGNPDGVFISRGDYSEDTPLYFHLLKITNTVPDGTQSTYYYDSKVFKLTKDSKYYKTYDADTDNKYSYYNIERSALTLDTNSSYLYVLSNSGNSISNSYGILQPDIPGGVYDVVESDTSGIITEQQALNDKISNINNNQQDIANSQQEIANNSNNINNYLNENTISNDTNENIDTNLDFNNQNSDLNNLNNGFFTRLTTMLSNISNYDLKEDTIVRIPFPNSQRYLELHSNVFYNNVTGALRAIINAFWTFIFTFYLWKFINKIYISVSSGSILDNFSSSGETITNDML